MEMVLAGCWEITPNIEVVFINSVDDHWYAFSMKWYRGFDAIEKSVWSWVNLPWSELVKEDEISDKDSKSESIL